jgi:hypothetical protein
MEGQHKKYSTQSWENGYDMSWVRKWKKVCLSTFWHKDGEKE